MSRDQVVAASRIQTATDLVLKVQHFHSQVGYVPYQHVFCAYTKQNNREQTIVAIAMDELTE